jgi:hypothetical protein
MKALGAACPAALLVEISEGNAGAKRRLRLELRVPRAPLTRSFVDWQNRKSRVDDLDAQRRAIVDQVAPCL